MRWQSVARVVVAATGIGVAALVYMQLRDRPVEQPSTSAPLADPQAISVSDRGGTREILDADGAPAISITYETMQVFAGDRTTFDDVTAVFVRDGVRQTIKAKHAVATGKAGPTGMQPAQIVFGGGVNLSAENGFTVEADGEATYMNVEQKTLIPGPMRFTRGRLSGGGVGAELFMDKSVLWINSEARLTVAPELEGGTPIEAQATRIGLADADHYMRLEGDAVMTHQSKRLTADSALVSFTEVGDVVQFIEMRGRSLVRNSGAGASGRTLSADDINLEFAPDTGLLTHAALARSALVELRDEAGPTQVRGTRIDMYVAPDGETLTKLEATDPVEVSLPRQAESPATVICARSLLSEGEDRRGLTRAVFTGSVDYRETRPGGRGQTGPARTTGTACARAAATRVASAETLTLALGGSLGQVESARFRQNFSVQDGDLTASATEGIYDSTDETLELRSPTGATRPKVESKDLNVIANEIDVNLRTDGFDARGTGTGRVESTLIPSASATPAQGTGLFEPGKVITGQSNRLTYNQNTRQIVYEGAVFLVQEDSRLLGERVAIDDVRRDLNASGNVRSTMTLTTTSKTSQTPNKPTMVSAGELVYTESARTAVYTGTVVMDTASGERIGGHQVTLSLEKAQRALRSAEATAIKGGEVRIVLADGRQAAGLKATFDAVTDRYRVEGTPAVFVVPVPESGPGECSIGDGTVLEFSRLQGARQVTTEGGAQGMMRSVKCAAVMKVVK